jgi:hypothetical protein
MQNEKKETIRKQLKDLFEHLKEKNTDGTLTEACGRVSGVLNALDDEDSNPPGTPPPPPGSPSVGP